jgi:hypothetical protein
MKHKPDTEEFGWMDFYFFTERSDLVGASSQTTLAILDSKGDDLVYYYNNALWVGGWEWDDAMSTHTDVNQLIQDRVCGTASKICLANVDNEGKPLLIMTLWNFFGFFHFASCIDRSLFRTH